MAQAKNCYIRKTFCRPESAFREPNPKCLNNALFIRLNTRWVVGRCRGTARWVGGRGVFCVGDNLCDFNRLHVTMAHYPACSN